MESPQPRRPEHMDPLAFEVLEALRDRPEVSRIVLGGHFALKHYLDYRLTHDVDASADDCWEPWQKKNPDLDVRLARAQVVNHLEAIGMRRPLAGLPPAERAAAASLREWARRDLAQVPDQPASEDP